MARIHRPGGLARDPFYFYHLSERVGVVVLSIPKNACTVQKRWLLAAEGIAESGDPHRAAFAGLSLLTRPAEVRERAVATLPMIGFVRDPLLRLASAFCDKLCGGLDLAAATAIEGVAARRGNPLVRDTPVPMPALGEGALFAGCSGVDYARGVSFRAFVEYVCATPDLGLDPHWRAQAWFVGPLVARAGRADAPVTGLMPVGRVSEVLGRLGAGHGLDAPPDRAGGADGPGQGGSDLSDVPGGELAGLGRRPSAAELYDEGLIGRVLERYAGDAVLWSRCGGACASGAIRAARGDGAVGVGR